MKSEERKNKKSPPAYLKLYEDVRGKIVSGVYPFGKRLPSKRTMAQNACVSTVTVEHAYDLLTDEGYIEAKERRGYFVIFRTDDGFASFSEERYEQTPAYEFDSSDTLKFPFSVLAKTMRSVMSDRGEDILENSPGKGRPELREAISKYLARSRGITAGTDQIIIGSGSEYLYSLTVELLGRDKTFAIEYPSYKKIEEVYRAADVKYDRLVLKSDGISSRALKECSADVIHISPYRSFPSGITASASKRHEYVRWGGAGERYIIEDDFESEFSVSKKPEETVFSLSDKENVIYMNTFSKTLSSSLRVGYMVLPKRLLSLFDERIAFYSCTVSTYIQLVLAELISNGDFERHINRVRRKKRKDM